TDEASGIGGTGIANRESGVGGTGRGDESGVGGTGIYGTLTAFGSICVNGLRVHYSEDVSVERNDQPANRSALALGQVVWVVAGGDAGRLITRNIAIHSAVVGEVSSVDRAGRRLMVSGSAVQVPDGAYLGEGIEFDTMEVGDRVDVSGLRVDDGEIVASRIDTAGAREADLAEGPNPEALVMASGGLERISVEGYVTVRTQRPRVGGLVLDLSMLGDLRDRVRPGQRVHAHGRLLTDGVLRVEPPPRGGLPKRIPLPPPVESVPRPEGAPKLEVAPKPEIRPAPSRPRVQRSPDRPQRPVRQRPERPVPVRPQILDVRPLLVPVPRR
ncbi:MAG: DUF5666 domain-containing protein, partial [Myxococcota bacterium]